MDLPSAITAAINYLKPCGRVIAAATPVLFLDMFVYTSLIPMTASLTGSELAHFFQMRPADEMFIVVELVFVLSYLLLSMNLESRFWEDALSLDETALCILDIRALYVAGLQAYYIMELVQVVQHVANNGTMKSEFLGEDLPLAVINRINHWMDVIFFHDEPTIMPSKDLAAANFVLVVAHLFATISHYIIITTLYGQISTLREFRGQLDHWIENMQQLHRIRGEADVANNNANNANANAERLNENQNQNDN